MLSENVNQWQITTDVYSEDGTIKAVPESLESSNERDMFRQFLYLRFAYPDGVTRLTFNGYILSTLELSKIAHLVF